MSKLVSHSADSGISLIKKLHLKNRAHTTDEFEESIGILIDYIKMHQTHDGEFEIHQYQSGQEFNYWKVPQKWNLRSGALLTTTGEPIISIKDHPLVVIPFSHGFRGKITREELFDHLHYREDLPDAIPYVFRKQYRHWEKNWGLAIPYSLAKTLNDAEYEVIIDADFEDSTMKLLEYTWRGQSEQMITLCAHLDHTGQCNDGLSGVMGIVDTLLELQKKISNPFYTYRLIICPEISGSAIYLQQQPDEAKKIVACLCPNMIAHEAKIAFCTSKRGNSPLDQALYQALVASNIDYCTGVYRQYPDCGDEISFDSPGLDIPTSTISRIGNEFPYYHTSLDSMEHVIKKQYVDSVGIMVKALRILESNYIPKRNFIGNPCLANSHFNLYLEPKIINNLSNSASNIGGFTDIRDKNREPDPRLFMDYFLASLDGDISLLEIADNFSIPFEFVYAYAEKFRENGLIEKYPLFVDYDNKCKPLKIAKDITGL